MAIHIAPMDIIDPPTGATITAATPVMHMDTTGRVGTIVTITAIATMTITVAIVVIGEVWTTQAGAWIARQMALAEPDNSSNNSAHTVGNERMGSARLPGWLLLGKRSHPNLISTYRV